MTTITSGSYFSNVVSASRELAAAIFSFGKPLPAPADGATLETGDRMRQIRELFSLAKQYESTAPSLASELRYFAGKL